MKKCYLTLASLMMASLASAQIVGGYKATSKQDISLKDAKLISSNVAQNAVYVSDGTDSKKVVGKGFPIGFEFPFNGQKFSYFGVTAQGVIKLSQTEDVTVESNNYFVTQKSEDYNNSIFSFDSNATSYAADNAEGYQPTSISYKNDGDELVVEWKNLGINTSSWSEELVGTYTMQIHLLKDGTIRYTYAGLSNLSSEGAGKLTLGVRGGANDYLVWDGLDAKTSYYAKSKTFNLSAVSDGYTITLDAPTATVTPTMQPTNLKAAFIYGTSVSLGILFDEAEDIDNYLMLVSQGEPTVAPADGTFYAKDDSLGNAKVILAGRQDGRESYAQNLQHDADYYVTIYGYNSYGTEGPKYNLTEPLKGTFHSAPTKPGNLKVLSATNNSLKLSVAANEKGNKIMVVYNDSTHNPGNRGNCPYVGKLDASLKAGDYLTYDAEEYEWNEETGKNDTILIHDAEAGKVAYFGEAGEFEITGLQPSHSYYFTAYSYDDEKGIFSEGADSSQVWTSTNITVPYEMNINNAPIAQMIGGWVAVPGDYNEGFCVMESEGGYVSSHTGNSNVIFCENRDPKTVYTLTSPTIELTANNKVSLDWHIHMMSGFAWMQTPAAYEEWGEDDYLAFVAYVDDERVELKKYTSANAPTDLTAEDWHSESFDLSAYEGKNIKFAIEWLGAMNATLRMGIENIKLTGDMPTKVDNAAIDLSKQNGTTYNLQGMQVAANTSGIVIQNSKKKIQK